MKPLIDTRTYTCGEPGVCQSRTPACAGCTAQTSCTGQCKQGRNCTCSAPGRLPAFTFAPGVIDHTAKPTPSAGRWLLRWVYAMLVISLLSAVAGYLS